MASHESLVVSHWFSVISQLHQARPCESIYSRQAEPHLHRRSGRVIPARVHEHGDRDVSRWNDQHERTKDAGAALVGNDRNYVCLHTTRKQYVLRSRIADVEQQLDPARFVRVHRSAIVRQDLVRELEPLANGGARARW